MSLSIGHITYANCAPFFSHLREVGFEGEIVPGVPSRLNQMLAEGFLDLSPSSSFEYARNWRDYLLLPGHSISTFGPVKSVLLFSEAPLDQLEGASIALTGESATSVNLLKVLLQEFVGLRNIGYALPQKPVEEQIAEGRPGLLIGDRALKTAMAKGAGGGIYDLGELWCRYTGLPFVFALWILRLDSARRQSQEIRTLQLQLNNSRQRAFSSLENLAKRTPERAWMPEDQLVDYWRCMSYDLDAIHLEGLRLFCRLCLKHGLLEEMPEFAFFE